MIPRIAFEIPAAITKAGLAATREFKGKANAETWSDGEGNSYAPGEIIFMTFHGARNRGDPLFRGVFRFAAAPSADVERVRFSELPNAEASETSIEREDDNGI